VIAKDIHCLLITVTIAITTANVLPTTTTTGGTPFGIHPPPPQTREKQLLAMIATLQQQVNTMLLQ